jgi:hypothetical protein
MAQQADSTPSLPEASVVDAEALHALRAVQRMLVQGGDGGQTPLVGGTIAASGLAAARTEAAKGAWAPEEEALPPAAAPDAPPVSWAPPEGPRAEAAQPSWPGPAMEAAPPPLPPARPMTIAAVAGASLSFVDAAAAKAPPPPPALVPQPVPQQPVAVPEGPAPSLVPLAHSPRAAAEQSLADAPPHATAVDLPALPQASPGLPPPRPDAIEPPVATEPPVVARQEPGTSPAEPHLAEPSVAPPAEPGRPLDQAKPAEPPVVMAEGPGAPPDDPEPAQPAVVAPAEPGALPAVAEPVQPPMMAPDDAGMPPAETGPTAPPAVPEEPAMPPAEPEPAHPPVAPEEPAMPPAEPEPTGPVVPPEAPEPQPPEPQPPEPELPEPEPPVVVPQEPVTPPAPEPLDPPSPVAQAPLVAASAAEGWEDAEIALHLSATLQDLDGSETLSVSILGLPDGAALSAGTRQGDGSWLVSPADLSGLRLLPPADFSGTLDLVLRATAREARGDAASSEARFEVKVAPVVDGAVLAGLAAGNEDQWITLEVSFGASADASEAWDSRVLVHGLPPGAVLSQGEELGGGSWAVDRAALAAGQVAIRPPADSDASIALRLEAVLRDSQGGVAETTVGAELQVQVAGTADAPRVMALAAAGREDGAIALHLSAALQDLDGSETLSVSILGLPDGTALSAGTRQGDGSWLVSPADLSGLRLLPPADFSGTLDLALRATAREARGDAASSEARFPVTVAPVADPASLAAAGEGEEDGWIPLGGSLALGDTDGSERFGETLVVRGMPAGAMLSQGREVAPGQWEVPLAAFQAGLLAVRPPPNSDADLHLVLSVTVIDTAGTLEDRRDTAAEMTVVVRAVADAPLVTVADLQGREDTVLRLAGLGGALRDTDGSETLSFLLSGLPSGASLSAGKRQADGGWLLTPAQLAGVSMTPPAQFSGRFTLTLTAIATEGADGRPSARSAAEFTVSLDPVADAGSIAGRVTGKEDAAIALRPTFSTPDADGSESWSTVSRVSGLPSGAKLSQGTEVAPGTWDVSTAELRAGRVSVTPPANSDADFTLTITATLSDSGNGKTVSRGITGSYAVVVTAVADAPAAAAVDVTGFEDQSIPLALSAALRDTDGSESLSLFILGVPAGATLSRGSRAADGSWTVSPADLPGLSLTPPRDFSGSIALTLRAVAADRDNSSAATNVAFTVQVQGVADAPVLRTGPAGGDEDTAIALHASALTTDRDGSERILAFRLADVPEGAVVRAGGAMLARQADGSVLVAPGAINSLSITPPAQSGRGFTLRISAISAEPNGSRAESPPVDLPVFVHAVADAPVIGGNGGQGREDSPVPLDLAIGLVDGDGSETLFVMVSGLPAGARLSAGTFRGDGAWSLTAQEARHVLLLPPADFAGTIALTVTAVAQEGDGGSQARSIAVLPVHVAGVVDRPAVGGLDGHSGDWGRRAGQEDQPIALRLDPGLADRDGSEHVVGTVTLGGVPAGAVLRLADGTVVAADADGLHRLDAARMGGVTLTMPPDSDAAATLSIRMVVEDAGGTQQEIGGTLVVDPAAVADAPVLVVQDLAAPGHAAADPAAGWVPLPVEAALVDTDGSESLWVWLRDVPQGFTLSAGRPAGAETWLVPAAALEGLLIRPPAGFTGVVTLRVEAMAVEREGSQASTGGLLRLTVTADASGGGTGPGTPAGDPPSGDPPPGEPTPGGLPPGDSSPGSSSPGGSSPAGTPPLLLAEAAPGLEDTAIALRVSLAGGAGDGGGEVLGLRVEGVPEGARLSAGLRDPATGAWIVAPDQLAGLALVPPTDFSGGIHLTLRALAVQPDGTTLSTTQALDVLVAAVADAAVIAAAPAAGLEDAPVALNLRIAPADADGSESLVSVLLSGLPAGARIAPGAGITDHGDGTWSVEPAHLAEVMLLPPAHVSGDVRLTVVATTMEATGFTRVTAQDVAVSLAPVPQAPLVTAADAAGLEDQPIALGLSAALADRDGSESLSLVLEGLPQGSRLSAGVNNGDGSWTLTPAQLNGLTLTPPRNWSGGMALTLVGHAMEGADGAAATSRAGFRVEVGGVVDQPMIEVPATAAGDEDGVLRLDLRAALGDGDGSESLLLRISGAPAGSHFTAGTENADGSWTIPGAALPGLGFRPPQDYAGTLRLGIAAVAVEAGGGTASTAPIEMSVTIRPVTDAPLLALADAAGMEDMPLALSLFAAAGDVDGSENLLRVVVQGLPAGATLSAGSHAADGSWVLRPGELAGLTLRPPAHFSGALHLAVTAVAAEATTGAEASTTGTLTLQVAPAADAPVLTVADAAGTEDHALALSLAAALKDTDGSERLLDLRVAGLPEGFTLSAGRAAADGSWSVPAESLPGLRLLPAADWNGTLHLTVTATSEETANGARASTTHELSVSIAAVNDAPVLVLTPAAQAGHAGAQEAAMLGGVHVADADSAQLGGAVVTLAGAQGGDSLVFEGYALHVAEGRIMVGDTGIEVVKGGYDAASGRISLQGAAAPETYAAVLQSLVLENAGPGGLAAGNRLVSVVVRDQEGAEALQHSVTLAVEPPPAPQPPAAAASLPAGTNGAAVEASVLMAQEVYGADHAAGLAWTEQARDSNPAPSSGHWTETGLPADGHAEILGAGAVTDHLPALPAEDAATLHGLAERPHWF